MQITTEDSLSLIRPIGKIDSSNSQVFEQALTGLIEHHPTDILVDLEKVTFVASAGLRVMLKIAKQLSRRDRALRVFGLNGLVRETFEISGFTSILDVRLNEDDARTGLK